MTEQLDNLTLTGEQIAALEAIGDQAVAIVDAQYGTGFPHFKGGEAGNLAFHNGYHTRAVPRDAQRVGEALDFTVPELVTADVAGKAHDLVQLKPRGVMEAESADWLVEQLGQRGLPAAVAEAGALAILGTEPLIEGAKLVGQRATELDYPSRSAERVGLSVACGDFGELLAPPSMYFAHKLYQEIKGVDPTAAPPMEDLARYEAGQIALRTDFRFPLAIAETVLGTHRREVIAYAEETLRLIEAGLIESWQQLEARDLAFMRQYQ